MRDRLLQVSHYEKAWWRVPFGWEGDVTCFWTDDEVMPVIVGHAHGFTETAIRKLLNKHVERHQRKIDADATREIVGPDGGYLPASYEVEA